MEFVDTSVVTKWISKKIGICDACNLEKKEKEELIQLTLKSANITNTTESGLRQLQISGNENDVEIVQAAAENPVQVDVIQALGIAIIMIGLIISAIIILLGIRTVIYYKYSWAKFYFKLKQNIFYNSFIRFVLQSTLKMEISFTLTITTLNWKTKKDKS